MANDPNIARQGLYVGSWYLAEFKSEMQIRCVRNGGDFTIDSIVERIHNQERRLVLLLIHRHNQEVARMAEALSSLKRLAITQVGPLKNAEVAVIAMRGLQEME